MRYYEKLVDLVYSVNDEYRASPGAAWLMHDTTAVGPHSRIDQLLFVLDQG